MNLTLRRRFVIVLCSGCAFVALTCWLSTGTLAPYAATAWQPRVLPPCNYLANPDHPHFEATFAMLNGEPREHWAFSVMLRRILFPLIAWPAMKVLGFLVGGVITSVLIQILTLCGFAMYVRRRFGEIGALIAIPLLATYPGTYYWAGLPYPHVLIVPASLAATIILREVEIASSARRVAAFSAMLGVLFTAYDIAPFFLPPLIIVLLLRRKFIWAMIAPGLALMPMGIVVAVLKWIVGVALVNENTSPYVVILRQYFVHDVTFMAWMHHISPWPMELLKTYFWSNFVFVPAVFAAACLWHAFSIGILDLRTRVENPCHSEMWILLTGLALFLFNNWAPPYRGWQFHGEGVSRIYQPVIGAMLMIIISVMARSRRPWLYALLGLTCVLNASIALGPITRNPLAAWTYHKFYQHAPEPMLLKNLATYGRRPLGFCHPAQATKAKKKRPRSNSPASAPSILSSASPLCRDG